MNIKNKKQVTSYPFVNLFEATYEHNGKDSKWIYASRTNTKSKHSDAVAVIGIIPKQDGSPEKIVLIKQYRVPIGDYIIEFPAGLIDEGETPIETGKREFKEETGMDLTKILTVSPSIYNSAGLSDETVILVYGIAEGEPSTELNEPSEDIEVLVLDTNELADLIQSKEKLSAKVWLFLNSILFLKAC